MEMDIYMLRRMGHHDRGPTRAEPRETAMTLRLLAKDLESGKDGCKSVYLATPKVMAFQGPTVDPSELVNVLPGEGGVYVDVDIVRAALAAFDALGEA